MYKQLFLLFALVQFNSTVLAAPLKIDCSYVTKFERTAPGFKEVGTATQRLELMPNTTHVTIDFKNKNMIKGASITHNDDFNMLHYVEDQLGEHPDFKDGDFFGVRRDDQGNIFVKVIVGNIVNGKIAATSELWNFGIPDGSSVRASPAVLGGLTCQVAK